MSSTPTKRVLVTGGSGTIGSIVCNVARDARMQVTALGRNPGRLVGRDCDYAIADVADHYAVRQAFSRARPEIVVHAAANKHVAACESHPDEAIRSNVLGTAHVVRACAEFGVKALIHISSDKAVTPHNVYASSKASAEHLVLATAPTVPAVALRLGNVLGSAGSVTEIWRERIARGEPLQVREHRGEPMVRYVMTRQQVRLLFRDLFDGRLRRIIQDGSVLVPRLNRLRIRHLAEVMAAGSESSIEAVAPHPAEQSSERLIAPAELPRARGVQGDYVSAVEIGQQQATPYVDREPPLMTHDQIRRMLMLDMEEAQCTS